MSSITNVPLPYHTRVKGFISETHEVEMEQLSKLGEWVSFKVDEDKFRAMNNYGADVFFTEFNQDWDDETDELWVPDAEREYKEMVAINKEYSYFKLWGTTATEHWARKTLEAAEESILFKKFGQNLKNNFDESKSISEKVGACIQDSQTYGTGVIKFRRYPSGTEEKDSQEGEAASRSDSNSTGNYLAQRSI